MPLPPAPLDRGNAPNYFDFDQDGENECRPGHGTTTALRAYTFDGRTVRAGRVYHYRLKQVDFDGAFAYSPVVELALPVSSFAFSEAFPNPASGRAVLRLSTAPAGETELAVSVDGLPAGVYLVKVEAAGKQAYRKLIVE